MPPEHIVPSAICAFHVSRANGLRICCLVALPGGKSVAIFFTALERRSEWCRQDSAIGPMAHLSQNPWPERLRITYVFRNLWIKLVLMNHPSATRAHETDDEYRAIEAALLESARGRWFLAEHGRRARRLDSALLEDAIGRLQTSLRQPPALLDQLQSELQDLKSQVSQLRQELLARQQRPLPSAMAESGSATQLILKSAEDLHEVAWSLQANPFDPKGCEQIARNAVHLYTLSQDQAAHSERTLSISQALDAVLSRVDAVLETVEHERTIDPASTRV